MLYSPEVKNELYKHIKTQGEHDFWLAYQQHGTTGVFNGEPVHVAELRIGLHVTHLATPVAYASGKYKSTPFLTGDAATPDSTLKFVLVRTADGGTRGLLSDERGIRALVGDAEFPSSKN